MKLSELLNDIPVLDMNVKPELEISGVSYDSRKVQPGHLFVAITGYSADGHKYIPDALSRGAVCVLCERRPEGEIPCVLVPDCRVALAQLGANWFDHPADRMTILGVTGTNGKTSITYLLKAVLEKTLKAKVGLIGTIQNMIGDRCLSTDHTTPESFELQRLFAEMAGSGCTHVVMEVSSIGLYLHRTDCIPFTVGAFTNLTEDHLDFHKTMEAYRQAKALLFRRSAFSVFNIDDPEVARTVEDAACWTLCISAAGNPADLSASEIELGPDHVAFTAEYKGERFPVRVGIPGEFTVYNALTVLGMAIGAGIPVREAAAALAEAHGVRGRMEVVPTPGKPYTVLIDYAHTPDAVKNVMRSVRGFCKGRIIAVFGCGGNRDPFKRPIMGKLGVKYSDLAIITSDNPRKEEPEKIIADILKGADEIGKPYLVVVNRREAIARAMREARADDIIVLCGKGHETYQIIGTEVTHLDEREEVAKNL